MAPNKGSIEFIDDFVASAKESRAKGSNEAETRHKLIDTVIHDILSWPKNRVAVEEYIQPGYADYVLKKANGNDLLFIEAKRSGFYFKLPKPHKSLETSCFKSIAQLHTDTNIKKVMTQVRNYCMDSGCEFAAITNGYEWIFFKVFEKGKRSGAGIFSSGKHQRPKFSLIHFDHRTCLVGGIAHKHSPKGS